MRALHVLPDLGTFREIFPLLERTILSTRDLRRQRHWASSGDMPSEALVIGKQLFARAVVDQEREARSTWLPCTTETALLSTPSPADLHTLIRILGVANDLDSIMDLLRWMHRFAAELAAVREELSGGPRNMRRALTAVRIFLESRWASDIQVMHGIVATASEEQLEEAHNIVEGQIDWGGWPTNEEVQEYLDMRRNWVKQVREAGSPRMRMTR